MRKMYDCHPAVRTPLVSSLTLPLSTSCQEQVNRTVSSKYALFLLSKQKGTEVSREARPLYLLNAVL